MKKSLVALAVLGSFAGVASAATSVTLYGQVEVNYHDLFGKGEFAKGATADVTGLSAKQAAIKKGTLTVAQGLLGQSLTNLHVALTVLALRVKKIWAMVYQQHSNWKGI